MPSSQKNKYLHLFEDSDVKRWYNNVARGSKNTADVYLRRVGSFCKWAETNLKDLAFKSELDLYNLLLDYVTLMEQQGAAGSYVESTIKSINLI